MIRLLSTIAVADDGVLTRARRRVGPSLAVAVILGASAIAAPAAGAMPHTPAEIDPTGGDVCTNFYPELCMDASGGIDFGLFKTTDGYLQAVSALARHRDGDDADGNSIPDSVEIAVCGEAGCLPAWAEQSTPTEPKVLHIECCDGTFESDINRVEVPIPSGFNTKKLVSAFSLSDVNIHYFGAYPVSGSVLFSVDSPELSVGVHRFLVVGTAADKAAPRVAIWKVEVAPEVTSAAVRSESLKSSQSPAAPAASAATPVSRTGSNARPLLWIAAGAVLVGSAMFAAGRHRRDRRYY